MEIHLHDGPLDMIKHHEDHDVAVGDVVHPPGLPAAVGSGCYRVAAINYPSRVDGGPLPPTACANWGD